MGLYRQRENGRLVLYLFTITIRLYLSLLLIPYTLHYW